MGKGGIKKVLMYGGKMYERGQDKIHEMMIVKGVFGERGDYRPLTIFLFLFAVLAYL